MIMMFTTILVFLISFLLQTQWSVVVHGEQTIQQLTLDQVLNFLETLGEANNGKPTMKDCLGINDAQGGGINYEKVKDVVGMVCENVKLGVYGNPGHNEDTKNVKKSCRMLVWAASEYLGKANIQRGPSVNRGVARIDDREFDSVKELFPMVCRAGGPSGPQQETAKKGCDGLISIASDFLLFPGIVTDPNSLQVDLFSYFQVYALMPKACGGAEQSDRRTTCKSFYTKAVEFLIHDGDHQKIPTPYQLKPFIADICKHAMTTNGGGGSYFQKFVPAQLLIDNQSRILSKCIHVNANLYELLVGKP